MNVRVLTTHEVHMIALVTTRGWRHQEWNETWVKPGVEGEHSLEHAYWEEA